MSLKSLALLALLGATPALAQTSLDQAREDLGSQVRHAGYTAFLTSLIDLGVDAEIEGGNLTVDAGDSAELSISPNALPLPFDVELSEGLDLRAEVVVGYVHTQLKAYFLKDVPGLHTRTTVRYHSFCSDGGLGPSVELIQGLKFQALAHGAFSYGRNRAHFRGPGSPAVEALTSGVIFDTELYVAGFGGSGALRHEALALGPVELALVLRYDVRRYFVLHTDDDAPDGPTTTHWITARAQFSGPLTEVQGHGVRWIAGLGYRRYFDDTDDGALDFRDFVQLLAGVEVATPELQVSSLKLIGGLYLGEDVFGWTVAVSAGF